MTKKEDIVSTTSIEKTLLTVSKLGLPIVISVLVLYWVLIVLFPDVKEVIKTLNSQNTQCFSAMRDVANSMQKFETIVVRATEKLDNTQICEREK